MAAERERLEGELRCEREDSAAKLEEARRRVEGQEEGQEQETGMHGKTTTQKRWSRVAIARSMVCSIQ